MVKCIINAFDHMEFCLVLNLKMGDKPAVTKPPKIASWHVNFPTTINTWSKYFLPTEKDNF